MEYIRQAEEAWLNRGGEWMIDQGEQMFKYFNQSIIKHVSNCTCKEGTVFIIFKNINQSYAIKKAVI